jgi:anthranilate phosphoribosyltransferase
MQHVPPGPGPLIVIPSYNGARKLPVLTPLLALLLAREGLPVLIHGVATENTRVFTAEVLIELGIAAQTDVGPIAPGSVAFVPTVLLHPGLQRLLDVRRVVNLRNSAHSLVKLMNPCTGPSLLVTSYTHPEYAQSMAATLALTQTNALLLRGTEGEAVADPRRAPKMQAFIQGQQVLLQAPQAGSLSELPALPTAIDAASTARYIEAVVHGRQSLPAPIALQVAHIVLLASRL